MKTLTTITLLIGLTFLFTSCTGGGWRQKQRRRLPPPSRPRSLVGKPGLLSRHNHHRSGKRSCRRGHSSAFGAGDDAGYGCARFWKRFWWGFWRRYGWRLVTAGSIILQDARKIQNTLTGEINDFTRQSIDSIIGHRLYQNLAL